MKKLPKIFIVEDNVFYASLLKNEIVKNKLGKVESFSSGESFLENLFKMPDIVLLDYNLESMNGIEVLKNIKSINPNIQVIFLSAQEKMNVAITSLKYGAYDYVEKNDVAFKRINALINRILKFNQIVDEQKQFKLVKVLFGGLITLIVLLALYMQISIFL